MLNMFSQLPSPDQLNMFKEKLLDKNMSNQQLSQDKLNMSNQLILNK